MRSLETWVGRDREGINDEGGMRERERNQMTRIRHFLMMMKMTRMKEWTCLPPILIFSHFLQTKKEETQDCLSSLRSSQYAVVSSLFRSHDLQPDDLNGNDVLDQKSVEKKGNRWGSMEKDNQILQDIQQRRWEGITNKIRNQETTRCWIRWSLSVSSCMFCQQQK